MLQIITSMIQQCLVYATIVPILLKKLFFTETIKMRGDLYKITLWDSEKTQNIKNYIVQQIPESNQALDRYFILK